MIVHQSDCPCGSEQLFSKCCEPIISGEVLAPTAESLMRSRYSAFVTNNIDYLLESNHPSTRHSIDRTAMAAWAKHSEWLGLEILSTSEGGVDNTDGVVEFRCVYKTQGAEQVLHEYSHFKRVKDRWFYVDGRSPSVETIRREGPKVRRNDPYSCGSGKKFKKCCG